jgi:hypothetical protein
MMAAKVGYDAPPLERKDDVLGRWRLAGELFGIVRETPAEWSVRLGVFARWGEGKTTMLRFLERMALVENYIPVRFAPWAARTWDDLWVEFATVLVESLESYHVGTKSMRALKLKLFGKKVRKRVSRQRAPWRARAPLSKPRLEPVLPSCSSFSI